MAWRLEPGVKARIQLDKVYAAMIIKLPFFQPALIDAVRLAVHRDNATGQYYLGAVHMSGLLQQAVIIEV